MRAPLSLCVPIALLAVACGENEPGAGATPRSPTASVTATATTMLAVERDEQQVRQTADHFLRSLAENDPAGACGVMTPSERRLAQRDYGKCEWSFGDLVGPTTRTMRTGKIEVKGDGASIVVIDANVGSLGPLLFAVRLNGEWRIARKGEYRRAIADG